jgi:hypothetical protein
MAEQEQIGKYRPLEPLGSGGFAVVYRAMDTVLQREVALKLLKPQYLGDPEFVERFFREARTMAALDHPAIIRIFDVDSDEGRAFIAMELAAESLGSMLARRGPLPWGEALTLLLPICDALDYAHAAGLVHRDLKPANILISRRGLPLISDFGFARALAESGASMSISGGVLGTPGYIAPEIWDGGRGGPPADRYALACVAYELLTGRVLFQADTPARAVRAHVVEGPIFPASWPPGVPPQVREVLAQALRREPEARFKSAAAFLGALRALAPQPAPTPVEPRPVQPTPVEPTPVRPVEPTPIAPTPEPVAPAPPRRGFFAQLGGNPGCTVVVALALLLAIGGIGGMLATTRVSDVFSTTSAGLPGESAVAAGEASPVVIETPIVGDPATATAQAAPTLTPTIAPSATPFWAPEPAEQGRVLEGGGAGELFRAVSRDKEVAPERIPDSPSCLQGLIANSDGSASRQIRVEVVGPGGARRADQDELTGTYAICGLQPGDWQVRIASYYGLVTSEAERAAHGVSFHTSGTPGEIFYISFQAQQPPPAVELFPAPATEPWPPESYNGRWEGELVGQSPAGPVRGPFSFEVRDGVVVFTSSGAAPCPWGDPDLRATIANGFSFAGLSAGDGVFYEIGAQFLSLDAVEGRLAADRDGVVCLSDATWTAYRVP